MPSFSEKSFNIARTRINEARKTRATTLSFKGLKLQEVPESIGQLDTLQELFLHHNQITKLPDSLGNLNNLRCLHLDDNKFSNLPECLGLLVRLEELCLEENQLEGLPDSLGLLRELRLLRVSRNLLKKLPKSISQCANLEILDLAENQLVSLPESLHDLKKLKVLLLHGNEALGIPPEKLGPRKTYPFSPRKGASQQAHEILRYYYSTSTLAKRPLNEAKLILVGRGGAGKTSLWKRLINDKFDEGEDKTLGINVVPWSLALDKGKVQLNVWDFGGQEIMHATHQFFLTKRSLYILVINAREGDQDANVEYWLSLIEAYGEGSPVLVVVNKCEQHPLDLDKRGLRQKYSCIRNFVNTDCKTKKGLPELRAAIEEETSELPDLHTPFPKTWFEIKKKLEEMPEDCITYHAFQQLCSVNQEDSIEKQEVLIDYLHDLGSVLYFHEDVRLCSFGVLKPDWVTQGIYGLLNAERLKTAGGLLAVTELGTLLDNTRYPKQQHAYLLALMEKFELCFEIPNTQHEKFLIPELLPKETPDLPVWENGDVLGFEYHYNILPEGLLPRFIVRTHAMSEGCARWRNGVELRRGDAIALVRSDIQARRIYIDVRGPGRQPRELLAVLRHEFEDIHGGIKGLFVEEKVPVPGYPQVKLDYRKLLVREAHGKSTVEFETDTKSIELPLGILLDNFEEPISRHERIINIVRGDLIMTKDNYDFSKSQFTNSVVGAHMQNITNAIQQMPPKFTELRTVLEELHHNAEPVLIELMKIQPQEAERAAKRLGQFVEAAKEEKIDKNFLQVTAKGLIAATKTVASMAGPIIATVDKLKGLLGF